MPILLLNKDTKKWEIITKDEKKLLNPEEKARTLFLADKLKEKLDFAIKWQKKNNDVVGIIDGKEGSGKSSLAGNIMRYITNDTFDPLVHMIGADYEDALDKIEKAKHKGSLMFDEGNVFFMSTETTKKESRELHKVFSIFRQLNLFVVICLPSFFRLNSYFAVDRSHFLCTTYANADEKGFFAYYGEKKKSIYYTKGRKEGYNRNALQPTFRRRFTQCTTLENPEYKAFKLKTLREAVQKARPKKEKKLSPIEIKRQHIDELIKLHPDKTSPELGAMLGISQSNVRARRCKMKKNAKEIKNE